MLASMPESSYLKATPVFTSQSCALSLPSFLFIFSGTPQLEIINTPPFLSQPVGFKLCIQNGVIL